MRKLAKQTKQDPPPETLAPAGPIAAASKPPAEETTPETVPSVVYRDSDGNG